MLPFNVLRNGFHRPGAVERNHRIDVVDRRWPQFFKPAGHARAVQLERALGLAAGEHLKRSRIIKRNVLDVDGDTARFSHACDCVSKYGKVLDAEEIEFQEPDAAIFVGDGVHVVLRDELASALGVRLYRRPFDKRRRGDHDARRVDAHMPHAALDALRKVQYLVRIVILVVERLQVRFERKRAVDGHREPLRAHRDKLRDAVASGVGVAQGARDVADRRPRHHGAEGAYLCDVVLAVFLLRIRDHLVAAVVGHIHIDIRRLGALGVEESFEGELIEKRVHVRDAGEIGD